MESLKGYALVFLPASLSAICFGKLYVYDSAFVLIQPEARKISEIIPHVSVADKKMSHVLIILSG